MRPIQTNGFVLVVVLWVLAALTLVTIGFGHRAMLDRRAAAYALDHARAMMFARGAVSRGIIELQNKSLKDMTSDTMQMTHLGQPWAQPTDLLRESNYFTSVPLEEAEFDSIEFRIIDAESRININSAPEALLEKIEGLERRAVRNILKRRTEPEREGEQPMLFQAVEELRYMEGIDEEDWLGEKGRPGLKDLFTVYGDGKININTASENVLLSLPEMDEGTVAALLSYRAGPDGKEGTGDDRGYKDLGELINAGGISERAAGTIAQFCKFTSNMFIIRGVATLRAGKVRASVTAVGAGGPQVFHLVNWQEEPLGA